MSCVQYDNTVKDVNKNHLSNWLLHMICIWMLHSVIRDVTGENGAGFIIASLTQCLWCVCFSASSSLWSLVDMNPFILLLQYCVTEDSPRFIDSLLWKPSTTNYISREMFASGRIWIFSMNTIGMKMIPFNNIWGMFCITHKLLSEW